MIDRFVLQTLVICAVLLEEKLQKSCWFVSHVTLILFRYLSFHIHRTKHTDLHNMFDS